MEEEIEEIENLLNRLDSVRESFEKVESREQEIHEREKEIVEEVLERFSSIVRFVGQKWERGYRHAGGQHAHNNYDYDAEPSIRIIYVHETGKGEYRVKKKYDSVMRKKDGDQNRGYYTGRSYNLYEDGLKVLKYSGSFSNWQGESSSYESKVIATGTSAVGRMLNKADLTDILAGLKYRVNEAIKENENKEKFIGKRMKTIEALEKVIDL